MEVALKRLLDKVRQKAKQCKDCPLWENATQTVFGEGAEEALVMFIGEQPGDQEDVQGHPFVGPAGQLLDKALSEAHINRDDVYITNAVKHFKWIPHGNKRLHKTPGQREINACSQWIEKEIEIIKPRVIVCLGATAAKALFGKEFKVSRQRGSFVPSKFSQYAFATLHPSAILRIHELEARTISYKQFVQDLSLIHKALH